jgi:hypothetical protein
LFISYYSTCTLFSGDARQEKFLTLKEGLVEGIVNLKKSLDELSPLISHFWVFSGPSSGENLG